MDQGIAEKRVFTRTGDTDTVYIAAGVGIVSVAVSADRVGEFGVIHRCSPADIAAAGSKLAVAIDDDVLLADGDGFTPTGFGPATAVGIGDRLTAAAPDGSLATYDGDEWSPLGRIDAEIRAIAGDLVASSAGVYRLTEGLPHVGLSDVNDVAIDGLPLAATTDGLYSLGNGWMRACDGDFWAVATDGEHAHAATAEGAYVRAAEDWTPLQLPGGEPPIDFAHGSSVFAITADGTLLVDAGDGFRAHPLGLPHVVGLVVPDQG